MAKTKKEFSKEAMYKKIMPSMFKVSDDNNKTDSNNSDISDDGDDIDILDSNLSNLFVRTKNIYIMDNEENEDVNNVNDTDEIITDKKISASDDITEVQQAHNLIENKELTELTESKESINTNQNTQVQYKDESKEEHIIDKEAKSDISNYKYTVNFIEVLVRDKLNAVLDKFKCCKCESCINDVVDISLNSLPKYSFTGTRNEIDEAFEEFKQSNNIDVITAIIKAVILIRNKEEHTKN